MAVHSLKSPGILPLNPAEWISHRGWVRERVKATPVSGFSPFFAQGLKRAEFLMVGICRWQSVFRNIQLALTVVYTDEKLHNEDLIVCEGRILVHMPRVLVIDDAEYARDILKKILVRGGYEIAGEAGDGEAGLMEFSRTNPDIVIVDMIMPKMNGIETIRAIKKVNPNAKIIVISADGQMAHIEEAVKAGALSYINKPYQWSVVINELLQLTGGPQ